jgi:predicted nuclease of predicted toxin-antitoxin system
MLRLYANENLETPVVERLIAAGHDVILAVHEGAGREDEAVIRSAAASGRIIVTHDKDYGRLIFREDARGLRGVILIRLTVRNVENLADEVLRRVEQLGNGVWDHFVVMSDVGTRRSPLP